MRVVLLGILIFSIFLLSISPSHAMGISYEYLEDGVLKLSPGQNYYFKLVLQNEEEEDIDIHVVVESDIAKLLAEEGMRLPAKSFDNHVYFNISIPADAQNGDSYAVRYIVTPTKTGEGQVPFTVRYDRTLNIKIVDDAPVQQMPADVPGKPLMGSWFLTVGMLAVILVVLGLLWHKSNQLSQRIAPPSQRPSEGPRVETVRPEPPKTEAPSPVQRIIAAVPEVKGIIARKPVLAMRSTSPEKRFYLRDGTSFQSIDELARALETMSEDVFRHHVTSERNDFSNWIADALQSPDVAEKAAAARSAKELRTMLNGV